jgi:hypothetical protein
MRRAEPSREGFVRAVLAGAEPQVLQDGCTAAGVVLGGEAFAGLVSAGVLDAAGHPRPEARAWLKRRLLDEGAFQAQHRMLQPETGGVVRDLTESPLARLAAGAEPFLAPHQVDAGEQIRRLFERANLRQRVTMSYSADRVAGNAGGGRARDLSDLAIDARRRLNELLADLPADCAGVVLDVCGFLKGLQQVESERGWPRRSAKLVLRIGLDQAARSLGLSAVASGPSQGRTRHWGERPTELG